jgi:hypothetical protein
MSRTVRTTELREKIAHVRRHVELLIPRLRNPDEDVVYVKRCLEGLDALNLSLTRISHRFSVNPRNARWWINWKNGMPFVEIQHEHCDLEGRFYTHEHIRRTVLATDARIRAGDRPNNEHLTKQIEELIEND